ncbi:CPBP family intramembrane glutamic endopeptidase [Actinoplanes xinjiangensis]|uniref:CAAX prenyl protease-like protein n=1 Tax=Actinoplanes xinjiangensis TaxID=512350 RepID=A0A316F7M3_9ACTN|nr:CPBP family intramembrane glutamic endopeptidase [Actinoplanes xinjiangensis]PWK40101.1 CAAX prenyl protease-like protein [Actinoplanes xinjiangensis]GIF42416.1 abortive infection protein [Actinoplanes xinjiangensis]
MRSRGDVGVFLGMAFGLPWLLWGFEQVTGVRVLFWAAMVSVAVATWVAVRYVWRPAEGVAAATSITPVRPWRRTAAWCGFTFVLFLAMSAAAVALNAVTGVYPADLDGFSALRDAYAPGTAGRSGVPWDLVVRALVANLMQFVLILPLAFCEEWGWRGYLLNRWRDRLGTWPALILIGTLCGVWHLPFFVPAGVDGLWPLLPFTVFCVFFGVLLGWLRLASGSIWPAVVGHAVNNTVVFGFVQVVVADKAAEDRIDGWLTGLSGWQGLLIMGMAIAVLAVRTRRSSGVGVESRQG